MPNKTPNKERAEYVLGTDPAELERLGLQHKLWSEQAFGAWERARIGPGMRVLDVGCGPGFAAFDLATLVGPEGSILGIDESRPFIDFLLHQARARDISNLEAGVGDAQQLDLPAGSFDAAWSRWMTCFVPDPEKVVAGVSDALRPGGTFVIMDYLRYRAVTLAPRSEAFEKAIQATDTSWRNDGGDPDVGQRLPALLERHGMTVTSIRPIVRVATPQDALWSWPRTFFEIFLPKLISLGLLTEADKENFWTDWNNRSALPGAYLATPTMCEIIAIKR